MQRGNSCVGQCWQGRRCGPKSSAGGSRLPSARRPLRAARPSPRLAPTSDRSRHVTTLPERDLSVIRVAWRGMDDSQHHPLILTARAARPSRMNRPASMPPVRVVGRSRCKRTRACGWSGKSRQIGGMSAAPMSSPPPPCLGATTRPGPLSWPGWEKSAIRSWPLASTATTGDDGHEHSLSCLLPCGDPYRLLVEGVEKRKLFDPGGDEGFTVLPQVVQCFGVRKSLRYCWLTRILTILFPPGRSICSVRG
jgi:hypothetical protein